MAQDRDAVREVRERADLLSVIGEAVALRRAGRSYVGLCPFHEEKTPSFHVSPDKGLWYCFGCQAGGDVFAFVMKSQGMEFRDALSTLAARTGVPLDERPETPEEAHRRTERERSERVLERAAAFYASVLFGRQGGDARAYLRRRNISSESAQAFGLGYAPPGDSGVVAHLLAHGFQVDDLVRAGIVSASHGPSHPTDRMSSRLIFPIHNAKGNVVGFGGRLLGSGEPKYLNSPESDWFQKRRLLYGFDRARAVMRRQHEALLVEGYVDVVTLHQHGFTYAVASLGTALTEQSLSLLRREGVKVMLAYDADDAGRRATREALRLCDRLEIEARAVRLAGGKDPDEILRTRGDEVLRRQLEEALPRIDYLLAEGEKFLATPEGKAQVAKQVLAAVSENPSPVARDEYVRRVARKLEVSETAVAAELRRLHRTTRAAAPAPSRALPHNAEKIWHHTENGETDVAARREAQLVALLLSHPEVAEVVTAAVHELSDLTLREIGEAILGGGGMDGLAPELRRQAASLALEEVEWDEPERAARDLVDRLKEDRRRAQAKEVLEEVRRLEAAGRPVPSQLVRQMNRHPSYPLKGSTGTERRGEV